MIGPEGMYLPESIGVGYGPGGAGGGGVSVPFTYDADTYWWDFDYTGNTTDTLGDDTVSFVPERIRGEANARQTTKDYQPFKITDEGVAFGEASNRHYTLDTVDGISNGANGWYFCANVKMTSAVGYIFCINANGSTANSRARIYFTTGRQPAFRANVTDSGTLNVVAQGQAMVLATWYTLEVLWDLDADTAKIFINGAEQALTSGPTGGPWDDLPASDPSNILIGNGSTGGTDSFDGTLAEIVFYNGVPSSEIQSSIQTYVLSQRYDIPDAPVISTLTGNTTIAVSFAEPDDHNLPITDYEYQYKLDTEPTTWTDFSDGVSTTPGTTITGVTNDLKYDVRARAVNSAGNSDWSNISTVTPTANPGPPSAPTITYLAASEQIIIPSFSEPGNNGYDITDYNYYYRVNGVGSYVQFVEGTSATPGTTITGVTNGTAYQVYATAVNSQGEGAASNVVVATPEAPPDLSTIEATALMDIDATVLASYSGTGVTLTNLVASTNTAYDLYRGDGATSGRYPTFAGTPGDPATAKFTLGTDDYFKIKNGNTAFLNNIHKTTGGSDHWFIIFGTFSAAVSAQNFYSTKSGGTQRGLAGSVNSAEVFRFDQYGDTANVQATPATTLITGTPTFVAFSTPSGGGTVRHWMGTTTKVSTTRSFNATSTDPSQDLYICALTDLSGEIENADIFAIAMGNGYLDDADIADIVAEYEARHGRSYI